MSFPNAFRIARRELRGGVKGFRVFLACLALSVAAITAVGSVKESIELGLKREGAVILGGDAEIQLTYRRANNEERDWMSSVASQVSEIVDFRSMAVVDREAGTERGLTQVKAVDGFYPIYGAPVLSPDIMLDDALAGSNDLPGAVMDPVLIGRLALSIGDSFRLGDQTFVLMAALEREPDSAGGGFGLGPRTIVRLSDLQNSGLLAPGTLFESAYRMALPVGANLAELESAATNAMQGAGLRWRDARNGAPGVSQFVERLGAFLVLVGLAGLAVGGVGVSAAVRSYLSKKTKVIATLKTLGAEARVVFLAYGIQIGVLTVLGIALGLALGSIAPLALAPVIQSQLPLPAVFTLHPNILAEATLYGVLAAAIFTIWPLARTEQVRSSTLYRESAGEALPLPRPFYLVLSAVLVLLLICAAAWFSGLARLTFWSAAGLFTAFFALLGIARLTRSVSRILARLSFFKGRSSMRMALGSVGGPRSEAGSVILSLGLGLTVLAAIGQIDANFRAAIERDLPDVAPSYFVVDIQSNQLEPLISSLSSDDKVSKVDTAPMLRGVITQINGAPAAEVAGDHWVIQGDRGITYSAEPGAGTKITAGQWWEPDYTGAPQVSFAAEEALEMGLNLGDSLTINVLGRDITAEVTSFREVDFSNGGIGFILTMNPSALQAAPHSHIATIYAEKEAEPRLLRDVGNAYPNITMIRVRDAIARVTEVLQGIAAATTYGAAATLLTGFVVLIGAAAAGEQARTYEAAVLKTLGASRGLILWSFAIRSMIFGFAAAVVAIAAGAGSAWAIMTFVMDSQFRFEPYSALAIVASGVFATLASGLIFAWRPLATRPARVLRGAE